MSFQTQYELANMKNQIQPQQLTQNVFFGPINALNRLDFILQHNIKHFICIEIPTPLAVKYSEKIPMNKFDFNFINFDSKFNKADHSTEKLFEIMCFNQTFSSQLFNFIKKTLPMHPDLVSQEIYNMNSLRVLQSNIVTCPAGYERFEVFNDLLTIIKHSNNGNVMVVSSNGNDEVLTSLLVSQVMRENCNVQVLDAAKYVKALRPTISDISLQKLQYSPGFIEYSEKIKSRSWNYIMQNQANLLAKKSHARKSSEYEHYGINPEQQLMDEDDMEQQGQLGLGSNMQSRHYHKSFKRIRTDLE